MPEYNVFNFITCSIERLVEDIDLSTLAGRGVVEEYTSVRTYDGSRMTAKRIVADKPAVLISVLRYLINNIKTNLDAINGLLSGIDMSDDVKEIINTVLDALVTEDVDSVIELLLDLLMNIGSGAAETPQGPEQPAETNPEPFIPFVVGNFYWAYWVILAGVAVLLGVGIYFIFKKRKKKTDKDISVETKA